MTGSRLSQWVGLASQPPTPDASPQGGGERAGPRPGEMGHVPLEARGVSVRIGSRQALEGVDLAVAPGELIAIVGPNGAGKSTLLRALAGLVAPDDGRVELGGRAMTALDVSARARAVAYLPQDRIVHWPLTVEAVVELGRLPHRGLADPARDRLAVAAALRAMDVTAFAGRPVTALSGGERARVLLARALAQEAPILLADEPTAGLDPAHALALFEHLARLAREGRGVAVALHDLSLAARYCSRVLMLKAGRAVANGSPREVLTPETLARAYGIHATLDDIGGIPVVVAREALS